MVADKQALPDLQFVARSMEKCFARLEAEVLGKRKAVPATSRKSAARKRKATPTHP